MILGTANKNIRLDTIFQYNILTECWVGLVLTRRLLQEGIKVGGWPIGLLRPVSHRLAHRLDIR